MAKVAITHIKALAFDVIFKTKDKSPVGSYAEEQAPRVEVWDRNEFASSQAPPAPPQDPRLGDKTPAYMEWLGHYHPDEYKKRYKGRKTHLNAGVQPKIGLLGDVPDDHFKADPAEEWR